MERAEIRPTDVARAAERLQRPRARVRLGLKRGLDFVIALAMLVALLPLILLVAVLLLGDDEGWVEHRARLGRDGRALRLWRFRRLPGRLGQWLERVGARELPLLVSVLSGQLSFVGPRALPMGSGARHSGPRRLMAPGLTGPAQRWAVDADAAADMDDAYVEDWSLLGDLRLLACVRCHRAMPVRR